MIFKTFNQNTYKNRIIGTIWMKMYYDPKVQIICGSQSMLNIEKMNQTTVYCVPICCASGFFDSWEAIKNGFVIIFDSVAEKINLQSGFNATKLCTFQIPEWLMTQFDIRVDEIVMIPLLLIYS